jgi:mono/diheme cytochrome c family protein
MKTLTLLLALGATVALLPSVGKAQITGSAHDFYVTTNGLWTAYPGGDPYTGTPSVCGECHQIHHAPDPTKGPLWIHSPSGVGAYVTYDHAGSESYNMLGLAAPSLGDSSIACLSCHDGTVGINQTTTLIFDGTTGTTNKTKGSGGPWTLKNIGTDVVAVNGNDLTHTHPIGINYNDAVTTVNALYGDTELYPAVAGKFPYTRLKGANHSQIECSTCHDIHNTYTGMPAHGSALCLTCHNK